MLTQDQKRLIERFELPEEGWSLYRENYVRMTVVHGTYSDRWTLSKDGSESKQERSTDGMNWILIDPDCGYPAGSEECLNGGRPLD